MNQAMSDDEIKALRSKTVNEIIELLPVMDRPDLVRLAAAEADDAQPRVTLTRAIAQQIETIDADNAPDADDGAAVAVDASAAPAWHAPDYTGPLDIEQANWRNVNIKPVGGVITK